jgi:hypothetical protein
MTLTCIDSVTIPATLRGKPWPFCYQALQVWFLTHLHSYAEPKTFLSHHGLA